MIDKTQDAPTLAEVVKQDINEYTNRIRNESIEDAIGSCKKSKEEVLEWIDDAKTVTLINTYTNKIISELSKLKQTGEFK